MAKLFVENIPAELKQLKQWVGWKMTLLADGKSWGKIPKNCYTGGNSQSNNADTWCDFKTALKAVDTYKLDGVGFMFANGYFGVDLDHVLDDEDAVNGIVKEFVTTLNSYAEVSQSGTGLHIICKGSLPTGQRRNSSVEMYQEGRFFIMTGDLLWGEVREVRDCTEEIKSLHEKYLKKKSSVVSNRGTELGITLSDKEIIEKAGNSKQGAQFKRLYAGNMDGYDSQSSADIALCNILAFWCGKNEYQMDTIFRSSGLMRDKWDRRQSGSTYGKITLADAIENCREVYSRSNKTTHTEKTVQPNKDVPPAPVQKSKDYAFNDTGNAERFVDYFGDNLFYMHQSKSWLIWDGKCWVEDLTGEVKKLADETINRMKMQAWETDDDEKKEMLLKWAHKTSSSKTKVSMLTESQHIGDIPKLMSDFDLHKDFFNCKNGIVNLKNGELIPHDKGYMMTKISNCEYDNISGKQPERWIKFLDDVTGGDKELQRYIQKAVGYSLTGSIREQCLFMCYGLGQNGKSTFLETVTDILGGYARNAQTETIMLNVKGASGGSSASPDIARLKGARMVTANEPNQGVRMNEGLVKQLTGGDKITARFLHSREFEFVPEFKLWMSANNKPIITGTDQGIWRRMRLIPFIVAIPESKRDKSLKAKLNKELPQILKWAVDGCIMWLQEGLNVPACVEKATAEYRQEMDSLGQFCDLAIESDGTSSTKFADIYEVYVAWAEENHEYLLSANKFGKDLVKRYPDRYRLGDGIYYKRIKLTEYATNIIRKTNYNAGYQQKFNSAGA